MKPDTTASPHMASTMRLKQRVAAILSLLSVRKFLAFAGRGRWKKGAEKKGKSAGLRTTVESLRTILLCLKLAYAVCGALHASCPRIIDRGVREGGISGGWHGHGRWPSRQGGSEGRGRARACCLWRPGPRRRMLPPWRRALYRTPPGRGARARGCLRASRTRVAVCTHVPSCTRVQSALRLCGDGGARELPVMRACLSPSKMRSRPARAEESASARGGVCRARAHAGQRGCCPRPPTRPLAWRFVLRSPCPRIAARAVIDAAHAAIEAESTPVSEQHRHGMDSLDLGREEPRLLFRETDARVTSDCVAACSAHEGPEHSSAAAR